MPIYDYVCGACGHRFEQLRGLNEAGPHQCPECGGPVSRAFAPPTILFKGSGWAKVDRRATSAPTRKAAASGRPAGEASKEASSGSGAGDASPGAAPTPGGTDAPSTPRAANDK